MTAAALDNTGSGKIELTGSGSKQALLDVTGSAGFGTTGVLSGHAELSGDSAIEFASGQIISLAAHAQLRLVGNDAFIEDSTALGSNSALTRLASIRFGATLKLKNGASVSTAGALANSGTIDLDPNPRRRRIEPDGGGDADQQRLSQHRQHFWQTLGVGRGDGGGAR